METTLRSFVSRLYILTMLTGHWFLHLALAINAHGFDSMLMTEDLLVKYSVKRHILDVQLIN
jgi:hypothetical protein